MQEFSDDKCERGSKRKNTEGKQQHAQLSQSSSFCIFKIPIVHQTSGSEMITMKRWSICSLVICQEYLSMSVVQFLTTARSNQAAILYLNGMMKGQVMLPVWPPKQLNNASGVTVSRAQQQH
eukprot:scaffold40052_cov18-Prasinocladus_malaysianus.AAC.4